VELEHIQTYTELWIVCLMSLYVGKNILNVRNIWGGSWVLFRGKRHCERSRRSGGFQRESWR